MSWLSESVRSMVHGESKAERRARRAKEAEEAKLKAIGPAPKGDSLESQIASRTETPEERRKRLARLAGVGQSGDSIFDYVKLGNRGRLLGG